MGQGGTKSSIRTVVPANESNQLEDTEEDSGKDNVDKLGVLAEETDYPEPKPPGKDTSERRSQTSNTKVIFDGSKSNLETIVEHEGEMFNTNSLTGKEYQVNLVPVGASFQNIFKKRTDAKTNTVDEFPNIDKLRDLHYPANTVTVMRSLSFRDSFLGSVRSSGMMSTMTQREAMLVEREKYEYLRLIAPPADSAISKGQVRRFHYDVPPKQSRAASVDNFRNIEDRLADDIAEKHRDHRAESYTSLVKDLTSDINSERLKVKVILAWMSKQSIGRLHFGSKPPLTDTPNGYMMLIQEGQGTFPVFFALLCRAASLKCAIISGISKGSHYEVGSIDTVDLKNTWNAVYVEGSWQLVHPLWVCKGVANRQLGGWLKIEEEGGSKRTLSVASFGRDTPSFNPYFIFTNPAEFIYRNFPDEQRWQLLTNPILLEEFMQKMYVRPIFFLNKFKLQTEDACILRSDTGEPCEITINFPKLKSSDAVFGYELSMKLDRMINTELQVNGVSPEDTNDMLADADRYVMMKKSESSVTFEVRFSKKGTYKLRLYGGYYREFGNKPPWIIDVLMRCDKVLPKPQPLPFDPGPVGWGPGPISESLGLYVPSHVESQMHVSEEEDTIIYFILHNKLNATAELQHCKMAHDDIQEFVETCIVAIGDILTLQIKLSYPGNGEFGLRINVTHQREMVNACNYILHGVQKRPFEKYYPRRARGVLLDAMETCDVDFVKSAIDECERSGLPDTDPDVLGGRNRFEFLSCKTELYVALLVNRIDVSEHALYRARKANHDILLGKEMMKVEEHLDKLQKLDEGGWICDIPEIDRQSLVELSRMRKPKLEVRLVVTAMYMLLGIEEEDLKDWRKVRKLLRDQQSTLIEIARLEKYLMLGATRDVTVDVSVLERIHDILLHYTQEDIRRADNAAAAYFQWVSSVAAKLQPSKQPILEKSKSGRASTSKSTSSIIRTSTKASLSPKEGTHLGLTPTPLPTSVMSKTASAVIRTSIMANTTQQVESVVSRKASAVTQQSLRDQSPALIPTQASAHKQKSIKEKTTMSLSPAPVSKNTSSVTRNSLRESPHIPLSQAQTLKTNSYVTKKARDSSIVRVSPAPLTKNSFRNKSTLSEKKAAESLHAGPIKQITENESRDTDSMASARSLHISGKTFFSEKSVAKRELVSRSRSIKSGANGDIH